MSNYKIISCQTKKKFKIVYYKNKAKHYLKMDILKGIMISTILLNTRISLNY